MRHSGIASNRMHMPTASLVRVTDLQPIRLCALVY